MLSKFSLKKKYRELFKTPKESVEVIKDEFSEAIKMIKSFGDDEVKKMDSFTHSFRREGEREYLWSRQYEKKFRIEHEGVFMRAYNDGGFSNVIQILENNMRNKTLVQGKFNANFYTSVMWVSTDLYNADIGINENLNVGIECLTNDQWILYSDYKSELREKRLSKILDK